jgi:flagellar hook assembly protein FlgD
VDASLPAGVHTYTWDGRDDQGREVASGVYFCRLQAGEFGAVERLVLVR